MENLQDLLLAEMRDLYSVEKQLKQTLARTAKKAKSDDLREAIEEHLEQTNQQIERLEQGFEMLEEKPKAKKCIAMEAMLAEAKEMIDQADDEVLDAVIIAAQQKTEHYEISGYGSAHAFAMALGMDELADLLEETLNEEHAADERLTQLAVDHINAMAAEAEGGEETEAGEDDDAEEGEDETEDAEQEETKPRSGRGKGRHGKVGEAPESGEPDAESEPAPDDDDTPDRESGKGRRGRHVRA